VNGSYHSHESKADQQRRARELLASVGMADQIEKLPSEISGGMQKRVGLARALALDPDILLFDEPTANIPKLPNHSSPERKIPTFCSVRF
jgi:ABC-type transporter Mla maintaining outer membrane lipid asymmetry ATPase subunit MlaF